MRIQEAIGRLENEDMCNLGLINRRTSVVSPVPRMTTINTTVFNEVNAPTHGDSVVSRLAALVDCRQRFVARGNLTGECERRKIPRQIEEGISRAGKKSHYDGVKNTHDEVIKPTVEVRRDSWDSGRRHLAVTDLKFNTETKKRPSGSTAEYLTVQTDMGGNFIKVSMRMDDVHRYPSKQHAKELMAAAFRFAVAKETPEWEAVVKEFCRNLAKREGDPAEAAATGAIADVTADDEDMSDEDEDVAVGGHEALEVLKQIGAIDDC